MEKTEPLYVDLWNVQHYQTPETGTLSYALSALEETTKRMATVGTNREFQDSRGCESCVFWQRCGVTGGDCNEYIYEVGSLG